MSDLSNANPAALLRLYNAGFQGWIPDQDGFDSYFSDYPELRYSEIAAPHLAGSGKGKRVTLWRYREQFDPGGFVEVRQATGDCVSFGSRNAYDTSRCVEILVANEPEEYHLRSATEAIYGARGSRGQGMSVSRAARFLTETGTLFRQKYNFADLSQYNVSVGIGWGGRGVPEEAQAECNKHKAGATTSPRSIEDVFDLLHSGYALFSGQQVGFSPRPDKDGYSVRQGRWNHCLSSHGYDDTHEFYDESVVFVFNSWAQWNQKPERWSEELYGPWIPGMIVCRISDYEPFVQEAFAVSNINGFPAQELPDLGTPSSILG